MRITGSWEGQYTYGSEYGFGSVVSVPFRMSLTESWLGNVHGYVRDDAARGGMPERGRVAGRRKRSILQFVKTMPSHYASAEDGRSLEDLRASYKRLHGVTIQPDLPPHRIQYQGEVAADGMAMAGGWEILPFAVDSDRGVLLLGSGTGTWTARRVSDQASAV